MRTVVGLGLILCFAGCKCARGPVTPIDAQPVRVSPARLDFGRTFIGHPSRRTLELSNPNRFEVPLTLSVSAPFALATTRTTLGAAEVATVEVVFSPTEAGPLSRILNANDARVRLDAEGAVAPDCDAGPGCLVSGFDPDAGRCVTTALPDGLDCAGSFACFVTASCQQGECVGTLTTCADGDPCTLDVCGSTGCGHLAGLSACPEPDDPCRVPVCDRQTGCGIAPAVDGTVCGPRSCTEANVCINGQCVLRPAPQNQACTDVLAGVPAGQGTSDGPALIARFRYLSAAAYDARGNLFVLDACAVRKVSPSGIVKTIAGVIDECGHLDGTGLAARFTYPTGIVFDGTSLIVFEGCQLRRVSLTGVVTPFVGSDLCGTVDGIGAQARLGPGSLAMEPGNHKVLLLDREPSAQDPQDSGYFLREVSRTTGEVVTLARVKIRPPTPPNNSIALLDSVAVTADGGIFACVLESEVVGDMGLGGGDFLVQFDRSGASDNVYEGACLGVAADGHDLLTRYFSGIERWTGSARVPVAGMLTGYADGPVQLAQFNLISGLAVCDAGIAAIDSQNYNIRLLDAGQVSTLAGPRPDRRFIDGPASASRLAYPVAITTRADGGIFFLDGEALRQIEPTGLVSTLTGSNRWSNAEVDGPMAAARFRSPTSLAVSGDSIWVADWFGRPDFSLWVSVRNVDLAAGVVSTTGQFPGFQALLSKNSSSPLYLFVNHEVFEVSTAGVLTAGTDAGQFWSYQSFAADGIGGWYLGGFSALVHSRDGGEALEVTHVDASPIDGPAAAAGFGNITGLTVAASGDLYVTDYNRVRRYSPATDTVKTIFELSDAPLGIAAEPGGTLVVLVPNAILRLKP